MPLSRQHKTIARWCACICGAVVVLGIVVLISNTRTKGTTTPTQLSDQPRLVYYDMRDLIWHATHAHFPPVGTSSGPLPSGYTQGPPPSPPSPELESQLYAQITKLITDTVDPESWTVNGGAVGRIGKIDDRIWVVQSTRNQVMVRELLDQLRDSNVRVHVFDVHDLVAADPNFAARIKDKWAGQVGTWSASPLRLINGKLVATGMEQDQKRLELLLSDFRKRTH